MGLAQPLKYRVEVNLKNGEVLEAIAVPLDTSERDALDRWLRDLGQEALHTPSLTTERGKCYIPSREILYVEVVEDA